MGIFIVGSIVCAAAPSSTSFVLGRAISGFASAGIVAGCFTLLTQTLPLRMRSLYAGYAAAIECIATIASPLLGGILVDKWSWRGCFWINLPLAGITLVVLVLCMKDVRPTEQTSLKYKLQELDLVGNVVFVPSLTCLFIALSWGGTQYPWNSGTIIALFCVFAVLLAVFAVDQWLKQDSATLPSKVLKNRSVISGFIYSLCCNSAITVIEYYLPIYLQAIKQYSASESGYLLLPCILGSLTSFLIQGAGTRAIGYYVPFMLASSIILPVFSGLMTTLKVDSELWKVLVYSGFVGFGAGKCLTLSMLHLWLCRSSGHIALLLIDILSGIGFQAPQAAVQTALSDDDGHMGLAIIIFAQNFGPALFVALGQTIFTNRLTANLHNSAPGLNSMSIENLGLTELKGHVGAEDLHRILFGMDDSITQTWYLAVGLACVTMIGSATMEWRSVKQKRS